MKKTADDMTITEIEELNRQIGVLHALCQTKDKEIEKLQTEVTIYKAKANKTVEIMKDEVNKERLAAESAYKYCISKICESLSRKCDYE